MPGGLWKKYEWKKFAVKVRPNEFAVNFRLQQLTKNIPDERVDRSIWRFGRPDPAVFDILRNRYVSPICVRKEEWEILY